MTDIVLDPLRWEVLEAGNDAVVERWLAAEGDHVRAGQVLGRALVVHESVDLLAPHAGVLEQILVPAGDRFGAGHPLARLVPF